MKRILIIVSIVIVFLGLVAGVYYFFFYTPAGDTSGDAGAPFPGAGERPQDPGDDGDSDIVIDDRPDGDRPLLVKIYEEPTAGAAIFLQEIGVGTSTATSSVMSREVRFVDRATGHIYAYIPETGETDRITNTTIPGVRDVYWFNTPSQVIFRYLTDDRTIETFSAEIQSGSLSGEFLSRNLSAIGTAGTSTLIRVEEIPEGSSVVQSQPNGSTSENVFISPLASLRLYNVSEDVILFGSRPTQALSGILQLYDRATGNTERIAGGEAGITGLSSTDGSLVLVGSGGDGEIDLRLIDRETGQRRNIPLNTLPEKCVWGAQQQAFFCMVPQQLPNALYPDMWYQGRLSFTDALWRINPETGTARAITFFDDVEPIDGIKLSIDEEDEYLTFINKRDEALWGLDI